MWIIQSITKDVTHRIYHIENPTLHDLPVKTGISWVRIALQVLAKKRIALQVNTDISWVRIASFLRN
jgi:hypothetical protein